MQWDSQKLGFLFFLKKSTKRQGNNLLALFNYVHRGKCYAICDYCYMFMVFIARCQQDGAIYIYITHVMHIYTNGVLWVFLYTSDFAVFLASVRG